MDTWAPGDKNSASDDLLVGVDLVDPHHFGLEQLDVLIRGGLLVDLQHVVLPDLNEDLALLQVAVSVNDADEGAGILKHDSVLFSHEKQGVDLLGEVDGGKDWVAFDVNALEDGILELLFEVVQV